ncbi:hypothetical protein BC829DRAFT_406710, partial [Chytridium lagenaria]
MMKNILCHFLLISPIYHLLFFFTFGTMILENHVILFTPITHLYWLIPSFSYILSGGH